MRTARLEAMTKGWFVGNFEPTALRTPTCEVAVKKYRQGDHERSHHHKIATEVTLILDGRARMNGIDHDPGSILVIAPGESTDFTALTDCTTVVVKTPSAISDKYED